MMADMILIVASGGLAMLIDAAGKASSSARFTVALPLLAILQITAFARQRSLSTTAASFRNRRDARDREGARLGVDSCAGLAATISSLAWRSACAWSSSTRTLLATMTLGARLALRGMERLFERERAQSDEIPRSKARRWRPLPASRFHMARRKLRPRGAAPMSFRFAVPAFPTNRYQSSLPYY